MITKTQIVNMALAHTGSGLITDFDGDTTKAGQYARLFWEPCLKLLLEDMDWAFATTRIDLDTPTNDEPAFGYAYAFALPDNFLMAVETDPDNASWKIENETLLTDESSIGLVYVFVQNDTAAMSAKFVMTLSYLLGSKLAMPLTRDPKIAVALQEAYMAEATMARNSGSHTESRRQEPLDTLTNVRYQA